MNCSGIGGCYAVVDDERGEDYAESGCHLHERTVDSWFGYSVGGIGVVILATVLNYFIGINYLEFTARKLSGAFETGAQSCCKAATFGFPEFIDAYAGGVGLESGAHRREEPATG